MGDIVHFNAPRNWEAECKILERISAQDYLQARRYEQALVQAHSELHDARSDCAIWLALAIAGWIAALVFCGMWLLQAGGGASG